MDPSGILTTLIRGQTRGAPNGSGSDSLGVGRREYPNGDENDLRGISWSESLHNETMMDLSIILRGRQGPLSDTLIS